MKVAGRRLPEQGPRLWHPAEFCIANKSIHSRLAVKLASNTAVTAKSSRQSPSAVRHAAESASLATPESATRRSWLPLLFCAILLAGCHANSLRDRHTLVTSQTQYLTLLPSREDDGSSLGHLNQANVYFASGVRQEDERLEGCVDFFYLAAIHAWRHLESTPVGLARDSNCQTAGQIYQRSLSRLIANAVQYGRLDPRGRLVVVEGNERRTVPIQYYGFAWNPYEFCQVHLASDYGRNDLMNYYQASGLGVPLVAIRHASAEETFYRPKLPFSVTAVLQPVHGEGRRADRESAASNSCYSDVVLTFYNPCLFDSLHVGSTVVALARDLSSPFAYTLRESPRKFTEGFLNPGDADIKPKLFMMEPYQRGKIPVVFIHGLWSDAITWADTVNTLRAQGDLYRRYQFWSFQYPTGGELLESAAELREKLLLAREQFDPQHQDMAMEQIILVGHSMGGLVAQLQSTYSYDILWRHIADRPLESVRTTPGVREHLRRSFFFNPSPLVKRVVFIATPHSGSGMSRRLVGCVASSLVQYPGQEALQYRQLMADNRDIFKEFLWDARPTTVNLLEPSNPLLLAMSQMPFGCGIQRHSIIGRFRMDLAGQWTDGVVPVSSARQAGVCSELFVSARHEKVHRDPACVAELMRILRQHWEQ